MTFTPEVWTGVLRLMKAELPAHAWGAWLAPLIPRVDGESLLVECPNAFHRDRIRDHYLHQIRSYAAEVAGGPMSVSLCTPSAADAADAAANPIQAKAIEAKADPDAPQPAPTQADPAGVETPSHDVDSVASPLLSPPATKTREKRSPHTFGNFVVGRCNALAREASLAMARNEHQSLQQLYLCAASGMGKTHLSRACVTEARSLGSERVLYTSAEAFTNEFMASVRAREMAAFKQRYRRGFQLLVVEDVQFLVGKAQTQLELFYTVRHVLDAGGRVMLTGDRPPRSIDGLNEQLQTQLGSGFLAELEAPDARVRRDILRAKAAGGGIRLPEDCLDLLVEMVEGTVRDIESVWIQLVTTASLLKRPIDRELARRAVATCQDAPASAGQRTDLKSVIDTVAGFFKTTPAAMASRSRRRDVLLPRQLAMYFCAHFTDATVAEIGRALGRNRPAVRNAIARIEKEMTEHAPLRYQVESLRDRLEEVATHSRRKSGRTNRKMLRATVPGPTSRMRSAAPPASGDVRKRS